MNTFNRWNDSYIDNNSILKGIPLVASMAMWIKYHMCMNDMCLFIPVSHGKSITCVYSHMENQ